MVEIQNLVGRNDQYERIDVKFTNDARENRLSFGICWMKILYFIRYT